MAYDDDDDKPESEPPPPPEPETPLADREPPVESPGSEKGLGGAWVIQ